MSVAAFDLGGPEDVTVDPINYPLPEPANSDDSQKLKALRSFLEVHEEVRERLTDLLFAIYNEGQCEAGRDALVEKTGLEANEIAARLEDAKRLLGEEGDRDFTIVEESVVKTRELVYRLRFIDEHVLFSIYHDFGAAKFDTACSILRALAHGQKKPDSSGWLSTMEIGKCTGINAGLKTGGKFYEVMNRLIELTSIPEYRGGYGFHIERRVRRGGSKQSGEYYEYRLVVDDKSEFKVREVQLSLKPKVETRSKPFDELEELESCMEQLSAEIGVKLSSSVPGNLQTLLRNATYRFDRESDEMAILRTLSRSAAKGEACAVWPIRVKYDIGGSRDQVLRYLANGTRKYALELGFVVSSVGYGYFTIFFLDETERAEALSTKYKDRAFFYNSPTADFSEHGVVSQLDLILREHRRLSGDDNAFPDFLSQQEHRVLTAIAKAQAEGGKMDRQSVAERAGVHYHTLMKYVRLSQGNSQKTGILPRVKHNGELEIVILQSPEAPQILPPPKNPGDSKGEREPATGFRGFMDIIGRFRIIVDKEEQFELFREIRAYERNGDFLKAKPLKDRYIASNMLLVVSIAKRYMGRGIPLDDLVQEGSIGLMRAVDKFDIEKGCHFSTYAKWWINQAITLAIMNRGRGIRIPRHIFNDYTKILFVQKKLAARLGRVPTNEEIAELSGLSLEQVVFVLDKISITAESLDDEAYDDSKETGHNFIPDPTSTDFENALLTRVSVGKIIGEGLAGQRPQLRRAIELKFGLTDGVERTFAEIGELIGVSAWQAGDLCRQTMAILKDTPA